LAENWRFGYWRYPRLAHSRELERVLEAIIVLVREAGEPWPKPTLGRPPVHSFMKMAVTCLLTVVLDLSNRECGVTSPASETSLGESLGLTTAQSMRL